MVIHFKILYKDSKDNELTTKKANARRFKGEEIKVLRFMRYFNVFNISDVGEIEFDRNRFNEAKLTNNEKIARCEPIAEYS